MFRSQRIIIRERVCTSLKILNYLKNTEFKILRTIPDVVAAKRVAGIRGDRGAVRLTHSTTRVTTYTCYTFCCHNIGNVPQDFKFSVF